MLIFPKPQVTRPFPVLRHIERMVLSYFFFLMGEALVFMPSGHYIPFQGKLWVIVRPLLNIKSPPSGPVFPLRRPPDSQGHDHICPTIPRVGGEIEGREQLVYTRQTQKGCYSGLRPHACPKPHWLVHATSACDLRCKPQTEVLSSCSGLRNAKKTGEHQGHVAL